MTARLPPPDITALLLAGGRGSRMGGVDKGLQPLRGQPLVRHALERLARQSVVPAQVAISANRNLDAYRSLGVDVWPDIAPGFMGPLAGFLTGLTHCSTPLLLTVPCDVPRFSLSLCERLRHVLLAENAEIAMAAGLDHDGSVRTQPVFCLLRRELRDSLAHHLEAGVRRVATWTAHHARVIVTFDGPDDDRHAFDNINTPDQLRAAGDSS